MRRLLKYWPIVAACAGVTWAALSWGFDVESRLTLQEQRDISIDQKLNDIREDVRDLKNHLLK